MNVEKRTPAIIPVKCYTSESLQKIPAAGSASTATLEEILVDEIEAETMRCFKADVKSKVRV